MFLTPVTASVASTMTEPSRPRVSTPLRKSVVGATPAPITTMSASRRSPDLSLSATHALPSAARVRRRGCVRAYPGAGGLGVSGPVDLKAGLLSCGAGAAHAASGASNAPDGSNTSTTAPMRKLTPFSSCNFCMAVPIASPSTRSNGTFSMPTTTIELASLTSTEAASMPMKDEPTTTIRAFGLAATAVGPGEQGPGGGGARPR